MTFISISAKPAGKPLRIRLCALFRTTAVMKPLKSKILFSCSLLTKPEGHHLTGGRRPAGAQAIPHQKPKPHQFQKSMKYNPLAYIRSEKDILKLVNALILNTKGEGEKSSEDFWVKAERLYYSALIGYIGMRRSRRSATSSPAGPYQRIGGQRGRRGVSVPGGSAVCQVGKGAAGSFRREAIPQI